MSSFDPIQILADLGDTGLMAAVGSVAGFAWLSTWWQGAGFVAFLFTTVYYYFVVAAVLVTITTVFLLGMWLSSEYYSPQTGDWTKYIEITDKAMAEKYKGKLIPIAIGYEALIAEKLHFKNDMFETLRDHRHEIFRMVFTPEIHLPFLISKFAPTVLWHSQEMDKNDIREVYDRGNDFYKWFLGEDVMLYTSALYDTADTPTKEAQAKKMTTALKKVHTKEGDRVLDIGCGWGSFVCHAAENFNVQATGITISKEGAAWAEKQAKDRGLDDKVTIKCIDYRDIPNDKWDRITCFEMAEHVGVKNYFNFMRLVSDRLKDDGMFYLQIAGLRRAWQYEDLLWGLFMNKYIFPGADASTPLAWYIGQAERAGFEVRSVETIGVHYSKTLNNWYDIWMTNKDKVIKKYGQYWFRLWSFFLAWSVIASGQGTATCYQIVLHKNTNEFNRSQFIGVRP